MAHLQRIKDALLHVLLVGKSRDLANHFAQDNIPGIVVLKSGSRRMRERVVAEFPHQVSDAFAIAFRRSHPKFQMRGQAGGVVQQLPDRHLFGYTVFRVQIRQVMTHGHVKIDFSVFLQLHQRQSCEGFADGGDDEGRLWGYRTVCFIGCAIPLGVKHVVPSDNPQGETGYPAIRHLVLNVSVDRRKVRIVHRTCG